MNTNVKYVQLKRLAGRIKAGKPLTYYNEEDIWAMRILLNKGLDTIKAASYGIVLRHFYGEPIGIVRANDYHMNIYSVFYNINDEHFVVTKHMYGQNNYETIATFDNVIDIISFLKSKNIYDSPLLRSNNYKEM